MIDKMRYSSSSSQTPQDQLFLLFLHCSETVVGMIEAYNALNYEDYSRQYHTLMDITSRLSHLFSDDQFSKQWLVYYRDVYILLYQIARHYDEEKLKKLAHHFETMARKWRKS